MRKSRKKKTKRNGNSPGVVFSSGSLAAAEWSEGDRSEMQQSAAAVKVRADSGTLRNRLLR
jgi:hypothetical protein